MPRRNEYKCNTCGLNLPLGWGTYMYVTDGDGNRVICYHPSESRYVVEVLGERPSAELVYQKTGFNSHCLCLECLYQFDADYGESYWTSKGFPDDRMVKDKRECPKCKSENVKTELELVGETCPKCKEGIIEKTWTGWVS
ncbi:hypothetical protein ACFLVM_02130 [Chloroflexota bacterium]